MSAPEEDVMTETTEAPLTEAISTDAPIVDETAVAADEAPVAETVGSGRRPAPATPARPPRLAPPRPPRARTSPRPSAAARRRSSACAWSPAPARSRSTAARSSRTSRTRCTSSSIREPLVITEKTESYDIIANLRGGGITGQAGALRLAVARALIEVNPDDRPALKKAGFLTRDARVTESKKYGLKKARKAPQYSKR